MRKTGWGMAQPGEGQLEVGIRRSGCAAGRDRIPLVFLAEADRDRDHRGLGFRRATVSA
jgi:hypothetical protein